MNTETNQAVKNILVREGVTFSAQFKPVKLAGATTKDKLKNAKLNFNIELKNDRTKLTTSYSKGYGHCHNYKQYGLTMYDAEQIVFECENGVYRDTKTNRLTQTASPTAAEVLYCLLNDAEATHYTFEEWCDVFGYDSDSRKAEKIYNNCLEIGYKLNILLPQQAQDELREILSDY